MTCGGAPIGGLQILDFRPGAIREINNISKNFFKKNYIVNLCNFLS